MKYLLILLFSFSVNAQINTEFVDDSTYWCIPQKFDGVPKYCGYGTYTHKHIPLAYEYKGNTYHVYTDNTKDDNFYVYVAKNNEEKVLVHTIEDWEDPHTNAAIYVKQNGIIKVHVSARGIGNGFQSGFILESKQPETLDFKCVDGCTNDNFEGYPQVWNTLWGEHVQYSHNMYDYDISTKYWMRNPWYRNVHGRTQLVKGGHYYISYYHPANHTLYVVYNWLVEGNADDRVNLYAVKTSDGVNWANINGKPVSLPLAENDEDAIIYYSHGRYTYLKDLTFTGTLRVLFTESDSVDPTKGRRVLKEWERGHEPFTAKHIETTGHNYNGAAYLQEYIITTNSDRNMIGGDIVLYQDYREVSRKNDMNCAYVRKVIGSPDKAVVSCDNFHTEEAAGHYLITLDD